MTAAWTRLRDALARPTAALPLDMFRIAVGLVTFAYFLRTLAEVDDISSPSGLIDHEFSLRVFWFTRLGLFHPGISPPVLRGIFAVACVLSLLLTLGYRVKPVAALLYVIAVSTYRWNFLVMYVDDAIIHLVLFWMLLLPVGGTLRLYPPFINRPGVWREWIQRDVPGGPSRCFFWNIALLYAVAGLWKWTSPMWRNGSALYAIMRLPLAYMPGFWGPDKIAILRIGNYAALALESVLPLIFVLPARRWYKYALLLSLAAFHCGIIATMRIPFANLACLAVIVLLMGDEIMTALRGRPAEIPQTARHSTLGWTGVAALLFVGTLTLAMASSATLPDWRAPSRRAAGADPKVVDGLGPVQLFFYSALWGVGIAQQYQLFNWIDDRNYRIRYEVYESGRLGPNRVLEAEEIFPRSTRGSLLQCYLFDIAWAQIPAKERAQLRRDLYSRLAQRYCRAHEPGEEVAVYSTVYRVTGTIPDYEASGRSLMMRFRCESQDARMMAMN